MGQGSSRATVTFTYNPRLRYLALIPAFLWFREQYELRKELKKLVRIILSKLNYDDKDLAEEEGRKGLHTEHEPKRK